MDESRGRLSEFFGLLSKWRVEDEAKLRALGVSLGRRKASALGSAWLLPRFACLGAVGRSCGGGRDGSLFT